MTVTEQSQLRYPQLALLPMRHAPKRVFMRISKGSY